MSNKNYIYSKETILTKHNKASFPLPKDRISNDALFHKELLFSDTAEIPLLKSGLSEISSEFYESQANINQNRTNKKYSNNTHGQNNEYNNYNKYNNNNNNNNNNNKFNINSNTNNSSNFINNGKEWRGTKVEEAHTAEKITLIPDLKYEKPIDKQDKSDYNTPTESKTKPKLLKLNTKDLFKGSSDGKTPSANKVGDNTTPGKTPKKKIDENDIMKQYFQDEIKKVMSLNSMEKLEKTKQIFTFDSNSSSDSLSLEFNIDSLSAVISKLNLTEDENLYYILHPQANSSYGPLTTRDLKEMIKAKMLTSESELRFIDVFNLRGLKPFSFFKLKSMSKEGFLNEIEPSSLITQTEILKVKNIPKVYVIEKQKIIELENNSQKYSKKDTPIPVSNTENKEFTFQNQSLQKQPYKEFSFGELNDNKNNNITNNNFSFKDVKVSNNTITEKSISKFDFNQTSQGTNQSNSQIIQNKNNPNINNNQIKTEVYEEKIDTRSNTEYDSHSKFNELENSNENYNKGGGSKKNKKKGKKPVDLNIKLGINYK